MNLQDIDDALPNGFHDMRVDRLCLDFVERTATVDVSVWVGDPSSSVEVEREAYRRGELILTGLQFCIVEAPDPRYAFAEGKALWCSEFVESDLEVVGALPLPKDAFSARFFVHEWNSFVHVAALEAKLQWK